MNAQQAGPLLLVLGLLLALAGLIAWWGGFSWFGANSGDRRLVRGSLRAGIGYDRATRRTHPCPPFFL